MVLIKPLPGIVFSKELSSSDRHTCRKNLLGQISGKGNVFNQYLKNNHILEKPEPSIYTYSITFSFPEYYGSDHMVKRKIRGFVALVRAKDLIRHENRHEDAELKIRKSIQRHGLVLSPILAMFDDKHHVVSSVYERKRKEFLCIEDDTPSPEPHGTKHTLARITDPNAIRLVREEMRSVEELIIADGHHRYEALKSLGAMWIPVFFVNMNDENLILMSWHRVIKSSVRSHIRMALNRILHAKLYSTYLYKVDDLEKIRVATHPSAYPLGTKLALERRAFYDSAREIPSNAVDLKERPLGGQMYAFKNKEMLVSKYIAEKSIPRSVAKEWFAHWERREGHTEKSESFRVGSVERLLLFGLYASYAANLRTYRKYYLVGTTASLSVFLKMLDMIVKSYHAKVDWKNEIRVAQKLVDKGEFDAAILVPVLSKEGVVDIARKRQYEELPAKFTCFLPKPGIGIVITQLDDLRKTY